MPVIRGTDGTPVSVPTSYEDEKRGDEAQQDGRQNAGRASLFGDSAGDGSGAASGTASGGSSGDGAGGGAEDKTLPPGQHAGRDAGQAGNKGGLMPADMPTKLAPGKSAARAPGGGAEPKTKIAGPAKRRASASGDADATVQSTTAQAQDDPMGDPVVGWLVVIDGPGKGHHLKLGYGQNSIGRGEGQRVRLDFGDSEISRDNHAMLTYDPRGRAFYIQQGAGTNLTYMNGAPVLSPTQLQPMNRIALGATTLLFVPLCGDAFNWDDAE